MLTITTIDGQDTNSKHRRHQLIRPIHASIDAIATRFVLI
jgi:hypothetical protein